MNLPPKADGINSASVTCGSYDTNERKVIPPVRQVSRILGYLEYFLCRCVLLHLFCNQGMTVDRETDRKKPCRGRGGIAPLLRARGLKCFCHERGGGVENAGGGNALSASFALGFVFSLPMDDPFPRGFSRQRPNEPRDRGPARAPNSEGSAGVRPERGLQR